MHESGLIKDLLNRAEEKAVKENIGKISKIVVEVSLFGGLSKNHIKEHFDHYAEGTLWENVKLEIRQIPYGLPLSLVDVK